MENGNPRDASVLIVLAVFTIPVILAYLWVMVKNWLEGVDNLDTDDKYLSRYKYANNYAEDKDKKTRPYLKADIQTDREHPPNASFFCRVDGKETFIEGPYEEEFLTRYESIKWSYKKKRRELKREGTRL